MRRSILLLIALTVGGAMLAASVVALAPAAGQFFTAGNLETPDVELNPLNSRSLMYAGDGSIMASLHAEENRSEVKLEDVPPEVVQTILAVEDEEFYTHAGFSLRSTIRALYEDVAAGEIEQGGSTITQQLIKNSVLTTERDLDRKVSEIILATELERELSKDEILERYLNQVYFGGGAYGVQAAAELYWGVDVGDLDWGEAALLAGIIRNPVGNDPVLAPDGAAERRAVALDRLVEVGHISWPQARGFKRQPLPETRTQLLPPPNDYFVEEVKQQLFDMELLGDTEAQRINSVFRGGLRVYTTFSPTAQFLALAARNDILPDTGGQFTAAMASVDPKTGAVRAMVGGPGFNNYKFNLATQGLRQPGSSFKIFVLVTAFEQGLVPNDSISGSGPCRFDNPGGTPDPYVAVNFGGGGGGTGTIASQTTRSSNCAFLRLGQFVGLDNVVETAKAMGVTSPLNPDVISLPIGSLEVSPLDMAGAAAVLANGGIKNEPYLIDRIEDRDGQVLYEHEPTNERVISEQSACLATQVLEQNVQGGTGTAARLPDRAAAGKTGTSQTFADAWFVGYTPNLATAVWMGNEAERVPMTSVGGRSVTGGSYPAQVWGRFNEAAHAIVAPETFPGCDPTRPGRGIKKEDDDQSTLGDLFDALAGLCPEGYVLFDQDGDGEIDSCLLVNAPATPPPTNPPGPTTTVPPPTTTTTVAPTTTTTPATTTTTVAGP